MKGAKDFGRSPVPGKSKVSGSNLVEENAELRRQLSRAKANLKMAKKHFANQRKKLTTENSKLQQKLSKARTKLKAADDLNTELQGNLVVAVRKIEHCTKKFAEKTRELIFMAERLSIGINEISTKKDSETLWMKKAKMMRTILDLQQSDLNGPCGQISIPAYLSRISSGDNMLNSEPGWEGSENAATLPRAVQISENGSSSQNSVEILADDDGGDSVDDCIRQIPEDWMRPQDDMSSTGGQRRKSRKGDKPRKVPKNMKGRE